MSAHLVADLLGNPAALVVVKATLVLALACVAGAAARDLSGARRHLLWLVALSSCVGLVVSSPLVPSIVVHTPMLAESAATTPVRVNPTTAASVRDPVSPAPRRLQLASMNRQRDSHGLLLLLSSPGRTLIVLWVIGCVALLARDALGFAGAARLARRASVGRDNETMRELAHTAAISGVRRTVRLGYSSEVQSPITFGVAAPVVLLPSAARSWSLEARRAVLVHETAHIARGDWLAQAVGRLACDLFWFHPLAWRVFARLRDDAERAADDCVLGAGMPAATYAAHLLDIARHTNRARIHPVAAVGIVSTSDLERRFVAMFDARRSRVPVTARGRTAAAASALLMLYPFASLHVAGRVQLKSAPRFSPGWHSEMAVVPADANVVSIRPKASSPLHFIAESSRAASIDEASESSTIASAHPNFSGTWKQDTVIGPMAYYFVSDSSIITQTDTAISIESRARLLGTLSLDRFGMMPFDGAGTEGFSVMGTDTASFSARVQWHADTLVVNTHAESAPQVHTIQQLTLSSDGNTLTILILNFAGQRFLFGGPHTFVFRRIAP